MGDYELERIRAEIASEKQMKEMLEQSMGELQVTVEELEKRLDTIDEETVDPQTNQKKSRGNEWKTRYETQVELNQQLEKQIIVLQDKIDEAKRTLKESRAPKSVRQFDEYGEITPYYIKQLEREKNIVQNQLRDLEWKLDQESKAYHKANEERKTFMTEINAAKGTIEHIKRPVYNTQREPDIPVLTPRGVGNMNIPQDQRILDPKRGPIRKTAAVKNLPRLE